jgi:hypothetical protein
MNDTRPLISLVIVAYEMQREIVQTVRSLSPAMQRGVAATHYELIVVDNGSGGQPDREACERFGARIRWLNMERSWPSPAAAINQGIREARAPLVGAMIDGARLASPGLLHNALLASRLAHRPVIATHGFHLGTQVQQRAVAAGYDEQAEDELLDRVDWTRDGYRLFEISVPGESSRDGWFELPAESNALFMPTEMWSELGGYDEAFRLPGGGLVNLDLFARACELVNSQVVLLYGEATFHQVHGGVSTNSRVSRWEEYHREYVRLRGKEFRRPDAPAVYLGTRPPRAE